MTIRSRWSALGPLQKGLLGFVLVLGIVVAIFDWNWFRHPLERYVYDRSNREVRIGDLHVKLGFSLEPTVRVRDLYVENAPWASKQPLIVAREATFTFSLRSVWQKRPVISRLVLVDAEVDIERQADGLRNWRLVNPDDRGPQRVRVLTLEAHRSRIRFVHRGIDLEVVAAAIPLASGATVAKNAEPLSTQVDFKGTYRGARFSGVAATSEVVSFRESGKSFPLRGHVASGKTRFDIDGMVADIFDLSAIDAKVRLAGPTLASLHPFVDFKPAVSRPYAVEAQVKQAQDEYTFAQLRGKIGDTAIAGEASYNRGTERPLLRAALKSEAADLADLASLVGGYGSNGTATGPAQSAAPAKAQGQEEQLEDPEPVRSARIFPQRPFRAERLRSIDAQVTMDATKLKAADMPAVESLRLTADLTDGVLQLKPLHLGMAGGRVEASLTFDSQQKPPSSRATIDVRNVRLEKLFPALAATARSAAPVSAHLKFAGAGNSIAATIGNSTGFLAATMERGRISNLLDAKLGLDGGKILRLAIGGDRDIALNCGAIAFDFRNGAGKSKVILLDTDETHTDGMGTVNLREEQLDLLLTPRPKHPGLFSLRSSIRVRGPLKNPRFSIEKRVAMGPGGRAGAPAAVDANGQPGDARCAAVLGSVAAAKNVVIAKERDSRRSE